MNPIWQVLRRLTKYRVRLGDDAKLIIEYPLTVSMSPVRMIDPMPLSVICSVPARATIEGGAFNAGPRGVRL